jgi:3-ketoacyl-CoA synthase
MENARAEALEVMSGCIDEVFKRTGIKPSDIDILVVNCSLFNPTPSLTAMVINKYRMRSDIKNYNLAGMGCSASVVSIDLVKDLLQVHKNQTALVVSTENITQNWYPGKVKSMLISNTLFRMGGAAILLSNKWKDGFRAKYQLNCTVRVHKGANDMAYNCVYQSEDQEGKRGVAISKDLLKVAGDALKSNLTILGPLVLPWSEQIKFFLNLCLRKVEAIYLKDKSYVILLFFTVFEYPTWSGRFNHNTVKVDEIALISNFI